MTLATKTRRKPKRRGAVTTAHKFSIPQLEALWISQGGNPASAPYAAAIIMAETGGDNNAVGDGGQSFSFAQFFKPANPDVNFKRLPKDPAYAMRMMIRKSNNGKSWSPWSTYNNGAYRSYLPQAQQTLPAVKANPNAHLAGLVTPFGEIGPGPSIDPLAPLGGVGGAAGAIAGSPGAVLDAAEGFVAIAKLITTLAFWLRVGEVLAGLVLIYMGLRDLGAPGTEFVGQAASEGRKVGTEAAMAAAV